MGEIAWGILSATILYGVANEVEVILHIQIERWDRPVRLRILGFLLHVQHTVVGVEHHHASALEFLNRRLLMTHDARSLLALGEFDEIAEGEEEKVVGSDDEEVIKTLT